MSGTPDVVGEQGHGIGALEAMSLVVRLLLAVALLITCGWLVPGASDPVTISFAVGAGLYGLVLMGQVGKALRGARS